VLGARYLVDGTVRVSGDNLRVSAELVDAETGRQLWSSRYSRKLDDIFSVQEDVAKNIIGTLDPEIDKAEQLKSMQKPAEQLDTWGTVRRGLWHLNRFTRVDALKARRLFETATKKDPQSSEALIQLGVWHFWNTWAERGRPQGWADMERVAQEALKIEQSDARPYMLIGVAQVMSGFPSKGRLPLRESLKLNPSQYAAYIGLGTSYILSGEPQNALEPLTIGMRLSPHDPYAFHTLGELAQAHHMLDRWDDGVEFADKSLRLHPRYWYAQVIRICCLARMGQEGEATTALAELLQQRPKFSNKYVRWVPFEDKHWNNWLVEGLNMAGLAELEQG
jgi:tetratricopeptide (TPR) repeat protein